MISLKRISRRHLRIAALSLVAFLVLFTLVGFFAVPPILKSVLARKLGEALERPVSIQEIRVNPYALSVTVRGFRIGERAGAETFLAFEELYLNAELSSILRLGPVLREIRLTRPAIRLVRHSEEKYNISDLLQPKAATTAPPSQPPRFSLNNIQVIEGSVDFVDEPVGKTHTVRGLAVGIPFISNIPSYVDIFVEPKIEARINDDPYVVGGRTKPFSESLESNFAINIAGLDIPKYLAYSPVPLKFKIPSGQLDIRADVTFARQKGQQTLTVQGDVILKDFALTDRGDRPVLALPAVAVAIAPTRPLERKLHVAKITIQSPELSVRREKDGLTNLQALLPDAPKAAPPEAEPVSGVPATPVSFAVDAIELVKGKLLFADASLTRPFRTTLQPIEVSIIGLGNEADKRATFIGSVLTEAKEEVRAEGEITLAPLAAAVKVATKALVLAKYAPYYRDRLRFDIEGGKLDVGGRVSYAADEKSPRIQATDVGLSVTGLKLRMEGEPEEFARIPGLAVSGIQADLNKRELTIGGVAAQKGYLKVTREADGVISLTRLLAAGAADAPPAAAPGRAGEPEKPWTVALGRAAVEQYAIVLEDRVPSPPTTVLVEDARLIGEKLSTAKNATSRLELRATVDGTSTVSVAATLALEPLQADGRLEVQRVALKRYAPYYRQQVLFDLEDGVLDLAAGFTFARAGEDPDVRLAGLTAGLENLRLRAREDREAFLSIPSLSLRNGALDLRKREVVVGELASQKGTLRVTRSPEGKLNLLGLVPPAPAGDAKPASALQPSAAAAPAPAAPPPASAPPWRARVASLALEEYAVAISDQVPADPVTLQLDDIRVAAQGLSTEPGKPMMVSLSTQVDKRGAVKAKGSVSVDPLSAFLDVSVAGLDLRSFQPYVADRLNILISEGALAAEGKLSIAPDSTAGLRAVYTGEIAIAPFAAMDKWSGERILRWESLAFQEIEAVSHPLRLHVTKLALTEPRATVLITRDGSLNLREVVAASPSSSAPSSPPAATPSGAASASPTHPREAPPDIRIAEATVQGGRLFFIDRSVTPNYSMRLDELGGRVSGLSSDPQSLADVDVRARVDTAPLEIVGKVNPLREHLYADIRARFQNMDLSGMTPYSGKYIGYTIAKGKLSFDVKYRIVERKLNSENVLFLDQLTLGDSVDSPVATRLPVKLAIALLKDRKGEIRLDLPVNGRLDDPDFSIWRVVAQMLKNLLAKAATSPFALLGAMFGGSEELRHAEFEYGRTTFTGASTKKLEALAKAMRERPGVDLDIIAHVDAERDKEALRKVFFDRKLRAQKARDLTSRGSRPTWEQVRIEPPEYEKYLQMAYDFEKFPKPRTVLGTAKGLPPSEMEKLILTHIQITPDDLRALAARRAKAAKAALIAAQVEPERIFIVEPRSSSPEDEPDLRQSRVDFVIK